MRERPLPYQRMIFVCANSREPGLRVSCGGEGRCGPDLLERLKRFVKENKLENKARVAKSGCQEKCEEGPNAVVLPENRWLAGLSEADADKIIEAYLRPLL